MRLIQSVLKNLAITTVVYTVAYIIGVVYRFELYNPFEWILHIPEWGGFSRVWLMFTLISYWLGNAYASRDMFQKNAPGVDAIAYMFALLFGMCLLLSKVS